MTLLFFLFLVLQVADIATTRAFLKRGLTEANPIVRWLVQRFGRFWPAPKVVLAGLAGIPLVILDQALLLGIVNALYAAAVGWNLWQIKKAGG